MENSDDSRRHSRRKSKRSSILKVPKREPLLEMSEEQEETTTRTLTGKRSKKRVSFSETKRIKLFLKDNKDILSGDNYTENSTANGEYSDHCRITEDESEGHMDQTIMDNCVMDLTNQLDFTMMPDDDSNHDLDDVRSRMKEDLEKVLSEASSDVTQKQQFASPFTSIGSRTRIFHDETNESMDMSIIDLAQNSQVDEDTDDTTSGYISGKSHGFTQDALHKLSVKSFISSLNGNKLPGNSNVKLFDGKGEGTDREIENISDDDDLPCWRTSDKVSTINVDKKEDDEEGFKLSVKSFLRNISSGDKVDNNRQLKTCDLEDTVAFPEHSGLLDINDPGIKDKQLVNEDASKHVVEMFEDETDADVAPIEESIIKNLVSGIISARHETGISDETLLNRTSTILADMSPVPLEATGNNISLLPEVNDISSVHDVRKLEKSSVTLTQTANFVDVNDDQPDLSTSVNASLNKTPFIETSSIQNKLAASNVNLQMKELLDYSLTSKMTTSVSDDVVPSSEFPSNLNHLNIKLPNEVACNTADDPNDFEQQSSSVVSPLKLLMMTDRSEYDFSPKQGFLPVSKELGNFTFASYVQKHGHPEVSECSNPFQRSVSDPSKLNATANVDTMIQESDRSSKFNVSVNMADQITSKPVDRTETIVKPSIAPLPVGVSSTKGNISVGEYQNLLSNKQEPVNERSALVEAITEEDRMKHNVTEEVCLVEQVTEEMELVRHDTENAKMKADDPAQSLNNVSNHETTINGMASQFVNEVVKNVSEENFVNNPENCMENSHQKILNDTFTVQKKPLSASATKPANKGKSFLANKTFEVHEKSLSSSTILEPIDDGKTFIVENSKNRSNIDKKDRRRTYTVVTKEENNLMDYTTVAGSDLACANLDSLEKTLVFKPPVANSSIVVPNDVDIETTPEKDNCMKTELENEAVPAMAIEPDVTESVAQDTTIAKYDLSVVSESQKSKTHLDFSTSWLSKDITATDLMMLHNNQGLLPESLTGLLKRSISEIKAFKVQPDYPIKECDETNANGLGTTKPVANVSRLNCSLTHVKTDLKAENKNQICDDSVIGDSVVVSPPKIMRNIPSTHPDVEEAVKPKLLQETPVKSIQNDVASMESQPKSPQQMPSDTLQNEVETIESKIEEFEELNDDISSFESRPKIPRELPSTLVQDDESCAIEENEKMEMDDKEPAQENVSSHAVNCNDVATKDLSCMPTKKDNETLFDENELSAFISRPKILRDSTELGVSKKFCVDDSLHDTKLLGPFDTEIKDDRLQQPGSVPETESSAINESVIERNRVNTSETEMSSRNINHNSSANSDTELSLNKSRRHSARLKNKSLREEEAEISIDKRRRQSTRKRDKSFIKQEKISGEKELESMGSIKVDGCDIELLDNDTLLCASFQRYKYHKMTVKMEGNTIIDITLERQLDKGCTGEEYFISLIEKVFNVQRLKANFMKQDQLSEMLREVVELIDSWKPFALDVYKTFYRNLGAVELCDNKVSVHFIVGGKFKSVFFLHMEYNPEDKKPLVKSYLEHSKLYVLIDHIKNAILNSAMDDDRKPLLSSVKNITKVCKQMENELYIFDKRPDRTPSEKVACDICIY